jgi:hypothetical protein
MHFATATSDSRGKCYYNRPMRYLGHILSSPWWAAWWKRERSCALLNVEFDGRCSPELSHCGYGDVSNNFSALACGPDEKIVSNRNTVLTVFLVSSPFNNRILVSHIGHVTVINDICAIGWVMNKTVPCIMLILVPRKVLHHVKFRYPSTPWRLTNILFR